MDIKRIIRKMRIDSLCGGDSLTSEEKELVSFLGYCFNSLEHDVWVKKDDLNIYYYDSKSKVLTYGHYIEYKLLYLFNSYSKIKSVIYDYVLYRFNIKLKNVKWI